MVTTICSSLSQVTEPSSSVTTTSVGGCRAQSMSEMGARLSQRLGVRRLPRDDSGEEDEGNVSSLLRDTLETATTSHKRRKTTTPSSSEDREAMFFLLKEAHKSVTEKECSTRQPQKKKLPVVVYDYTEPLVEDDVFDRDGSQKSINKRKLVQFMETTQVKEIPSFRDYSEDEHQNMWRGTTEIEADAERNIREYRADGCEWRNATEERDFVAVSTHAGKDEELVHPATYLQIIEEESYSQNTLEMFEENYQAILQTHAIWSDEEETDCETDDEDDESSDFCNLFSIGRRLRKKTNMRKARPSGEPMRRGLSVADCVEMGLDVRVFAM